MSYYSAEWKRFSYEEFYSHQLTNVMFIYHNKELSETLNSTLYILQIDSENLSEPWAVRINRAIYLAIGDIP